MYLSSQLIIMNKNARSILVTGGAGYIGSHAVKALEARGLKVIILDNLVYGHQDLDVYYVCTCITA